MKVPLWDVALGDSGEVGRNHATSSQQGNLYEENLTQKSCLFLMGCPWVINTKAGVQTKVLTPTLKHCKIEVTRGLYCYTLAKIKQSDTSKTL